MAAAAMCGCACVQCTDDRVHCRACAAHSRDGEQQPGWHCCQQHHHQQCQANCFNCRLRLTKPECFERWPVGAAAHGVVNSRTWPPISCKQETYNVQLAPTVDDKAKPACPAVAADGAAAVDAAGAAPCFQHASATHHHARQNQHPDHTQNHWPVG